MNRPKYYQVTQMLRVKDVNKPMYFVGVSSGKRKVAILDEYNEENAVRHFRFQDKVVTAVANLNYHEGFGMESD